ncbi:MAG: hypothetical protein SNJ71_00405 [Bacteroidales bacterium]
MNKKEKIKIPVVIDTREKKPWNFSEDFTVTYSKLETGDYSIQGLENHFIIERKGCIQEYCKNIVEPFRFENELMRLSQIPKSFIIFEFTLEEIFSWPPEFMQETRLSSKFLLKKSAEYMVKYGVHLLFAGKFASKVAESIIKRVYEWN